MLFGIAVIVLTVWLMIFGCGAPSLVVTSSAFTAGGTALVISLLGVCLNRHHTRDAAHAAKTMRPGALLGLYLTLSMVRTPMRTASIWLLSPPGPPQPIGVRHIAPPETGVCTPGRCGEQVTEAQGVR